MVSDFGFYFMMTIWVSSFGLGFWAGYKCTRKIYHVLGDRG